MTLQILTLQVTRVKQPIISNTPRDSPYLFEVLVLHGLTVQDLFDLRDQLVLHVLIVGQVIEQPRQRCRCRFVPRQEHCERVRQQLREQDYY